ncbi:hypothetical protein KC331_g7372 [Hortaea werneckii]|nr:hypothetical protein KC331_g7372 [Hortaea werneckii]KAI7714341.1 hypothetical protein KC353_g6881 [Hortaea werneckii]
MAEHSPEGVDSTVAFLNDVRRSANIEVVSASESSTESVTEAGREQSDIDNDDSKSTGSITEAGKEQSDIENDEPTSVNIETSSSEQGRVSRRNTGNHSANNDSSRVRSIDGAGEEQYGIGKGNASRFFLYDHLHAKNFLYGRLVTYKNHGLAHLFSAHQTVAIVIYHSAGLRPIQDILCECINMSIHYVTQLYAQGNYFASKDFVNCIRLFDWDITIAHDGNSHPWISLPDSVASILLTDIHRALVRPGSRFDPKDEFTNRFLGLPSELRAKIYKMVFFLPESGINLCSSLRPNEPRYFSMLTRSLTERKPLNSWLSFTLYELPDSVKFVRSYPTSVLLSLLRVNRQIYLEAVGLFYSNNHFHCTDFFDLHFFVNAISSPKPSSGIDRLQFIKHLSFNFNFEHNDYAVPALTAVFEKFYNLKELGVYIDEERWEITITGNGTPYWDTPEKYPPIDAFYNLIKTPSLDVLDVQGKCEKLRALLLSPPRALKMNKRQRVKKGKEDQGQKKGKGKGKSKSKSKSKSQGQGQGQGKGKGKENKGKKKDEDKWVVDKRGPWPPTNEHFELKIHVEGKDPETFKPNGDGGFRKVE